jgi:hypothetical protein
VYKTGRASPATSINATDAYLLLLSGVLCGYAVFGKGFAYLGMPPLYIGEIALFSGLAVLLVARHLTVMFASLPSLLLATMMMWVALRTAPYLGAYGIEALRDSMVVMYGFFAFIIIALVLNDPRRIDVLLTRYGRFIGIYVPLLPFSLLIQKYAGGMIPTLPGTSIPILQLRPGEGAIHMVGAVVYVMAGLQRATKLWIVLSCVSIALLGVQSRAALFAGIIPLMFAGVVLGKTRQILVISIGCLALLAVAYAVEPMFIDYSAPTSSAERPVSTRQLVDNVTSTVGSANSQGEGTKRWRIYWWDLIVADTVHGPNFWTGRGFGLNLADADGFQTNSRRDNPPLRSPHSIMMTILARAGVPGITLWLTLLASWFVLVLTTMHRARRRGDTAWAGVLLVVCCYELAMLINASFDVALEGPMLGIWFWCLFGFGIAVAMCYRTRLAGAP